MSDARRAGLAAALAEYGLMQRGGFAFAPDDAPPPGPSGAAAGSVALVGHAGSSIWAQFSSWRGAQPANLPNPLDAWSREVISAIAARFWARAVFPFETPYLPFQQWAMRAEGLRPSPLGILMHPEFGLWHAFRGALLFDDDRCGDALQASITAAGAPLHLCDRCVEKPCLNACPVDAYSTSGFAYGDCLAHVRSERGTACRKRGCLDRNACPHGMAYRYPPDQQAFHMAAYAGLDLPLA